MINTAVIVSIIDFGTPVFCCIPIAPDFNTARKNAINGPNTMSFLTINDASIPFVPKLYAKLFKKYPYDPRTSMQPAIPPIAPLAIIVPTNTFLGLIPTYSACFGFNPTVRILYPILVLFNTITTITITKIAINKPTFALLGFKNLGNVTCTGGVCAFAPPALIGPFTK